MTVESKLTSLLHLVQHDVGHRGLARHPQHHLFNACPEDFARACFSLAHHPAPLLQVVTGFYIPSARRAETDGPLGAVYLARTLPLLGIRVLLFAEPLYAQALAVWKQATLVQATDLDPQVTHLLALERVGPSHTPESVRAQSGASELTVQQFLQEVPPLHYNRCHTMRGVDITEQLTAIDHWFEPPAPSSAQKHRPLTLGIGDGGNEIGMGKIPWSVIRDNIPNGGQIACRIATDFLLVAGISNWGAYALASGIALVQGFLPPQEWYDVDLERSILREMIERGSLVDGVTGEPAERIDGLDFDSYVQPLRQMQRIVRG